MEGVITPAKQVQVQRELQRERRDLEREQQRERERREQLRRRGPADGPDAPLEVCAECPDRKCLFCPYGAAGYLTAAA